MIDEETKVSLRDSSAAVCLVRLLTVRLGKELKSIPALVTSLLPNFSDAPIRLQGKALNHIFESPQEVLHSIRKYYVNEVRANKQVPRP